jgi:hypothetical protein
MLARQWRAWQSAWAGDLVAEVQEMWPESYGATYAVPSVSQATKFYLVDYVPFPSGQGYVYLCQCPAGALGAVACKHAAAVHAYRLERRWGFRLKNPFCPPKGPKGPPRKEVTDAKGA